MHTLEPHYLWRNLYLAAEDEHSPFYGYQNSEVYFTDKIYDHIIHPQWDNFGAETVFIKQLYADYEEGYTILEFMGEWNDVLHNDIMTLKRDVIEPMLEQGINKFILLGENLLNFHADETDYYEEWADEVEAGWIALVNFRQHVLDEISNYNLDHYLVSGGELDDLEWHRWSPKKMFQKVNGIISRRLG
ncbi:hypothetical protein [Owenweeksia hongkongensis]|uniref:hypothetical protein n=1 Tax=Owenweeksia hongkongensis TaxID=253245 RepID=UPI003A8F4E52